MWFKLLLLLLYFLLLFIFSRLLEVVSWCDGSGSLFSKSRNLLDPVTLSVKKLKQLLDNRGVSYSWTVEKKDLIHLVEATGHPGEKEVVISEAQSHPTTQFSCGPHFYEEVEDTKDSIWLVQVATGTNDDTILDDGTWKDVISQVARFGVLTGMFRCSLDKSLCARKKWTSPRLILALPQGSGAKEDVVLHSYVHSSKAVSVVNWVRGLLKSRIKNINSAEELSQKWLHYDASSKQSEIRLVLFTSLDEPPMFLSSLAIKFTGRLKIATIFVKEQNLSAYNKYYEQLKLPTYLIITPEQVFEYGTRVGENFLYEDMEFFLKSLHPEMNDVFLGSLLLINAIVGFEIFLTGGKLWKRLVMWLICVVKYNCLAFLTWLFILTLYRFAFMTTVTEMSLKFTRIVNGTNIAAVLRNDWNMIWSYHFIILIYLLFGIVTRIILQKFKQITIVDDIAFFSDSWSYPWCNFITSCFFRPMATLTRPMISQDLDLEEGIELLIERLAVPNLWLQPMISSDYIKDLPVWKYRGWCDTDDDEAGRLDTTSSSEDEFTNSSELTNVSQQNSSDTTSKCSNVNVQNMVLEPDIPVQNPPNCVLTNTQSSHKCQVSKSCKDIAAGKSSPKSSRYLKQSDAFPRSNFQSCKLVGEISDNKQAPMGMLECKECSICIEPYHHGEMLCGLPCGHNYHMNCIMAWLYRDNHCCPICRRSTYKFKSRLGHLHSQ